MTERPESHLPPHNAHALPLHRRLRRFRRNRFWLLLYLWMAAVLPELILQLVSSDGIGGFFREGLILGPLFALVPAMVVFILCTAMPLPGINFGISIGYSLFLLLFYGAQLVHVQAFGTFFTVSDSFGAVERAVLLDSLPLILLMGTPFLFLIFLGRHFFSFRPLKSWKQHIPLAVICLLLQLLTSGILPLFDGTGGSNSYHPNHSTPAMDSRVHQLGLLTAWRLDVLHGLSGEASSDATGSASDPAETDPPSCFPIPLTDAPENTEDSLNILDLDFIGLADRADQDAIAQIHRSLANRTPSRKNRKTGIFDGCNLIQITSAGFSYPQVHPDQTPSLYQLLQEGIVFSNYYLSDWGSSVPDREYAFLTGSIPGTSQTGTAGPEERYLPLTMAQQLIPRGYSAWAICCDSGFSRCLEDLGYECTGGSRQSSRDELDQMTDLYTDSAPFILYCLFEDSEEILELEQAITLLITRLRLSGELERTVFLLRSCEGEDSHGSCLLWKPGIVPENVDDPASPLDLLPTLSNLFGLEFDSRLYLGRDVFSNAPPLVLFPDGSWISDRASYDGQTGQITQLTDTPADDIYIEAVCEEVANRLTLSVQIWEHDYWRHLLE